MKLLPASEPSELGLLSCFLRRPVEIGALCAERGISRDSFIVPGHAIVFGVLQDLWSAGTKIDPITVMQRIHDSGGAGQFTGAGSISDILNAYPTATNAENFVAILQEKQALRLIITHSRELGAKAGETVAVAGELVEEFARAAVEIGGFGQKAHVKDMRALVLDKLDRMRTGRPDSDVLPTGIKLLDYHSPMRLGSMPLVAALRKVGKSKLSNTVALAVARSFPVLIFSLEDSQQAVFDRLVANLARIPEARHHAASLSEGEGERMERALTLLLEMGITIRDDVHDLAGILAVARQWKAQNPAGALVVVDYAQLVRAKTRKQDNREQEVASVSRGLRLLGLELHIVMMVLSQLNKDGDTRESKSLEQDCTAKWMLEEVEDEPRRRNLLIPFQRNGESQIKFPVSFFGAFSLIANATEDES